MRTIGKRKLRRELTVSMAVAGSVSALVARGGGGVQRTQPCEQSSDCKGEMPCLNEARRFMRLPHECDACFEAGHTCSYTTSGGLSDDTFVCSSQCWN